MTILVKLKNKPEYLLTFRWKTSTSSSESHSRDSGGGKSRSSSSSSMFERDRLMYPSERGQLGRSASLEEDRSREMAAQFEEMIRSGRLPPHPMFDSHMAFRHYAPSPMEFAAQRDLFMRIMASQEGARLPHPAFTYFSPAMFNPLAHLQAAAVSQAAAAQAAHLAAAESHRERHRDRDTKSPREHKRDRDHGKYDKSDKRDKHKDKLDRDRERRDSPRPSSASGRSSTGSASERRDSAEHAYRTSDARRSEDDSSRISEISSHSSHGGHNSRAATPTVEEIDVGSPPPKKLDSAYSSDRIMPSSTNSHIPASTGGSYMNSNISSTVSTPQTSFNFSVSHLVEPSHGHTAGSRSPLERSGSTGSAASESSHASEHSLVRTSSTGSSISHHRPSTEHNVDSYSVFPTKQPSLESRDSSIGSGTSSGGGIPLFPTEGTATSTGLYRPPTTESDRNCSSPSASLISSQMSHTATVTTSNVTSNVSDTSVTSTYTTNKAISSPPRTYEYTHKKFAHRPMTKKERILGGKAPSVVPTQVPSLTAVGSTTTTTSTSATSSVFPTRTLEFPLKRVTEDPSSPERHTKKARILGVQRPTKVVNSILKEYSFYHRHQRHINQEYLVHMPKGKLEKKSKRRTIVGMPMKRKKRRTPRESMYMYPTRTGLRSASKPEDKETASVPEAHEDLPNGPENKAEPQVGTEAETVEPAKGIQLLFYLGLCN